MNRKILGITVIIVMAISCLTIVSADNNTTEMLEITNEETVIEDTANYIIATSISNNIIIFSDGFSGFSIDSSKASITTDDKFTSEPTGNSQIENYIKLAIIECYRQNRENEIGKIVSSFVDGTYESSSDEIISAVLNSRETIGNNEVTNIDNTTEATFNFELLKSADDEKSDCLAYKVSLKKVASEEKLASSDEDKQASEDEVVPIEENSNDKTTTDNDKTEDTGGETVINETNKTIINKTNTVIVNQNNTTIINQNNIKHINKTTDKTPENTTVEEKLMKTVGNPIFILIVVIAIIAVVATVMHRKD